MFESVLLNLTHEEVVAKIKELKKQDKKSIYWKELLVVYVTNNFETNIDNVEVKFIEGKYQIAFKKIEVTFEEIQKYISDASTDEEFYNEALKYVDVMIPLFNKLKIDVLEKRISDGNLTLEEEKQYKKERLGRTFNKILIALSIIFVIYTLVLLLGTLFRAE